METIKCRICFIYKSIPDLHKSGICKDCNYKQQKINRLRKTYRLSLKKLAKIKKLQDSKCKICGISEKELGKSLVVDHNHIDNNIRGLLCNNCNTGLGMFKDNVNSLLSAIDYLQNNGKHIRNIMKIRKASAMIDKLK